VSEKLAALEVVRRRLDDAGLGPFCLEVHSHKTKKGALLNDIAQRIKLSKTFREPRDLERHLTLVEEKKRLLTAYAALINKTIDPFNATVFEILWARDRCGEDVGAHREGLIHVVLPVVVQYTRAHFTQAEQFLSLYSQHLSATLSSCDSIGHHPWAWLTTPLGFEDEERLLDLLAEYLRLVETADGCCDHLEAGSGFIVTRSVRGLRESRRMLDDLPQVPDTLLEDLLESCQRWHHKRAACGICRAS
jgi:hypothetical protein